MNTRYNRRDFLKLGSMVGAGLILGETMTITGCQGRREDAINNSKAVPILVYHRVHKDNDPTAPEVIPGQYCGHVTLSVFKKQMASIADAGFTVVTHTDIIAWLLDDRPLPKGKVLAIDFDDNRKNVLENAFPVMQEYGFKGTMFVISLLADGRLPAMEGDFGALYWDQLAILKDSGWTIGAHTVTHPYLTELYNEENGIAKVDDELHQSQQAIEKELGVKPECFAYPAGYWNEQIEKIVKRYYRTARLWGHEFSIYYNKLTEDPYRLKSTNISMLTREEVFQSILAGAAG